MGFQKCDDPAVSDKTEFPTFARTHPPSSQSGNSLISLMRHYGWQRFTIVVEDTALLLKAGENLQHLAKLHNITVNDFYNISEYKRVQDRGKLAALVHNTYLRTRGETLQTIELTGTRCLTTSQQPICSI